jgi:hypothetical protein
MIEDEIIRNCGGMNLKCCSCGCRLAPAVVNIVVTMKRATWKIPVFGGFDILDYPPRAVAIICDDCARNNVPVQRCVEFQRSGRAKYHDFDSLEDVSAADCKKKYYFGYKAKLWSSSAGRTKLMLRAAREQSLN